MNRIALLVGALSLTTSATAAKNEVAVEAGVVSIGADSFATLSPGRAMPTWGLRGAYAVHDHVALFASVHTGQRGQALTVGAAPTSLRTAYNASTLTLGARADYTVDDVLAPYISAGLLVHHGLVRLDDDPTRRDNPGQIASSAGSFGGSVMVGTTIIGRPGEDVQPTVHIEAGWQGVLSHNYLHDGQTILPLGYSGPVFRAGAGLRF